ncbi:MAG: TonB-dependent receptor [Methylophilaceae bacterium]|nr:TonB-dependent receptor [Methylophilaceae bacterium]
MFHGNSYAENIAPAIPITGNPLGVSSDQLVVPVTVLNGRELSLRRESTLGETLSATPGVNSTYYGPNASRPIIRGMDGDRVRIMQNGVGLLDASAISPDHAVGADPFIAEQIEVIRGPATVLYGAGAIGGVVNIIDHRIPKEAVNGITGRGELRYGGAEREKGGVAVIDVGNGLFALHADVYQRKTEDLAIPGYAVTRRGEADDQGVRLRRGRVLNTAAESNGGALGASLTFDRGHIGLSVSTASSRFGIPFDGHELKNIDMLTQRTEFSSEIRELGGLVERVKFRMAHTDYRHTESENAEAKTRFMNNGVEGTLEAAHQKFGQLSGVVGFQFENTKLGSDPLGDHGHALLPSTRTTRQGIYVYEELPIDDLKLSMGGRLDRINVRSAGGGEDHGDGPHFGEASSKRFNTVNLSAGALFKLDDHWSIGSNLTHTERAPTATELFADGVHHATRLYERGNSELNKERSNGIDAQLRWKDAKNNFNIGTYYTRFQNFINLYKTGDEVNDDGEECPCVGHGERLAIFRGDRVTFRGVEFDGRFRVYESVGDLDLTLRGDYVRANNSDTGNPVPRISPMRLGFGLDYRLNQIGARLDVLRGFKQDRTDAEEFPTNGYTLVNATATYRMPSSYGLELFARARNLLNQEIREHSSFLKEISPMGGRALMIGIRGEF